MTEYSFTKRPSSVLLIKILGIAAAYFILARLSLLLAVPPGYASPIWLPAGMALTAVLLGGYRVVLGVWLGSFAANLWVGLSGGHPLLSVSTLAAGVIGAGAALQAIVAVLLISRYLGRGFFLDRGRDVLGFLVLGGPLSCLVNASVSVTSLLLAGIIPPHAFWFSWFTWWAGDSIGAMVVTPILLSLFLQGEEIWKMRRINVSLPLCLLLAVFVCLYIAVSHREQQRIEAEFKLKAELVAGQIQSEWEDHLDALYSEAAFFDASDTVGRIPFRIFAHYWLARHYSIQAMEWIPRVPDSERAVYEEAARRDGLASFMFTEREQQGRMVERTPQPEYYPVYYVEPYKGNEMALGFDLFSNDERRNAINRALTTGKPVGTGRITLVQETANQYGFLVFLPVYTRSAAVSGGPWKREDIKGLALGVFRIGDAMQALAGQAETRGFHIRLTDLTVAPDEGLLYDSSLSLPVDENAKQALASVTPWAVVDLNIAERHWQLAFWPTNGYLVQHRSLQAWTVLAGGLVFASVAAAFLLVVTGRTARVELLVNERTDALRREIAERLQKEKALQESERNYREIFNTTSDGLVIYDETGTFYDVNDRACATFGYDRTSLLGLSIRDLSAENPAYSQEKALEKTHQALVEGNQLFEWHCRRSTGQLFWAEIALRACEIGGNRRLIASIRDVTTRKLSEKALRAALSEKEILLREIHHRVKNNMQMISSLLALQAGTMKSESLEQAFFESQQRIDAMAMVHETLYSGHNLASIDLSDYLRKLVSHLERVYSGQAAVQIILALEKVELSIDLLVPCGLILNELLVNAFKHAFPQGRKGTILIKTSLADEKELVLEVRDDGVGLPADLDFDRPSSLGLRLVKGMVHRQLKGNWDVASGNGTAFTLRLPLSASANGDR